MDNLNEIHDVHEDVKDIKQIPAKTRQSATLRSSATVVQQMSLKPEVFHGQNDIQVVEEVAQLLIEEETSRVCILAQVGWGRLQFH